MKLSKWNSLGRLLCFSLLFLTFYPDSAQAQGQTQGQGQTVLLRVQGIENPELNNNIRIYL